MDGYSGDPRRIFLPSNPFLDLLGEDAQQQNLIDMDQNIRQAVQPEVRAVSRYNFKLPEFWPHAPAMWFARAQFHMEVAGISAERDISLIQSMRCHMSRSVWCMTC